MVIEERDFRLTPISESSLKFDLELLYTVKHKDGTTEDAFDKVAYGLTLEGALKRVAQYRVNNHHRDDAIRLVTYFKEFREELDSLKELCGI